MINRFDTFTKLNEVILGKVNYSLLPLIEDDNERKLMENILQRMDQVFADLEKIFKSFNIKVKEGTYESPFFLYNINTKII